MEPCEQAKPDQRWRGLPLSLYTDRHGVFQAPPGREGQRPPTLFARAMTELGINQVFARSPQAKGRVEQLAGTFQDRLVTELRHAAAATIAEAQAVLERFLPRYNARFRVEAAHAEPAYRARTDARPGARPGRDPRLPTAAHGRSAPAP